MRLCACVVCVYVWWIHMVEALPADACSDVRTLTHCQALHAQPRHALHGAGKRDCVCVVELDIKMHLVIALSVLLERLERQQHLLRNPTRNRTVPLSLPLYPPLMSGAPPSSSPGAHLLNILGTHHALKIKFDVCSPCGWRQLVDRRCGCVR